MVWCHVVYWHAYVEVASMQAPACCARSPPKPLAKYHVDMQATVVFFCSCHMPVNLLLFAATHAAHMPYLHATQHMLCNCNDSRYAHMCRKPTCCSTCMVQDPPFGIHLAGRDKCVLQEPVVPVHCDQVRTWEVHIHAVQHLQTQYKMHTCSTAPTVCMVGAASALCGCYHCTRPCML